MFLSRLALPRIMRRLGDATITVSFIVLAVGAMMMCFAPGLLPRVGGLVIVGLGGAPLYPLTVDRLYASAEHKIDSISLGAICALASGVAVTLGPLALGVLADSVGLRRAMLIVPVIATVGAITQRPARATRIVVPALD
jgi:MFS family permease